MRKPLFVARKDEAAGNNEPPSRAPGLQARRGAQDFRRGVREVVSLIECQCDEGRKSL